MFGELKSLFDNKFFEEALQITPINEQKFTIKYFTQDARITEDVHLYCFIGIQGSNFDGNDFFQQAYDNGIRIFILQKTPQSIPKDAIVYIVDNTINALASMATLHKKELQIPHVLITGSVGKTTTRLILTAIMREKYAVHTAKKNWNNVLGVPLSILETDRDAYLSVLEAGMSSKGEIAHLSRIVNPEIAVITNIGLSHAEFLGTKDQVAEAKIEIIEGMDSSSILIINKNDPYKELFNSKAKGQVVYFDPDKLYITEDKGLEGFKFAHQNYPDFDFVCPIPGEHLLLNLAIVFSLIDILQIPLDCIQRGLLKIEGLDNRMRVFQTKNKVNVIADCYNASLESFKASLNVLSKSKGKKIAVIGSILELGQNAESIHREIGQYINTQQIDLVLAVGNEIEHTCQELTIPYCHFQHKEDIWNVLKSEITQGDTILIKASNGLGLDLIVSCLEKI